MAEVDDAIIDVVASEVINGCIITGDSDYSDKTADASSVEMRVKRKAKRLAKSLSRDSGIVNGHGGTATVVQLKRRWKNNRKSRNGYTKRGDVKKGKCRRRLYYRAHSLRYLRHVLNRVFSQRPYERMTTSNFDPRFVLSIF